MYHILVGIISPFQMLELPARRRRRHHCSSSQAVDGFPTRILDASRPRNELSASTTGIISIDTVLGFGSAGSCTLDHPTSRVEQFVSLLSPLQPLHPLLVHLLGDLLISLLLLLCSALLADGRDSSLCTGQYLVSGPKGWLNRPVARLPSRPSSPFLSVSQRTAPPDPWTAARTTSSPTRVGMLFSVRAIACLRSEFRMRRLGDKRGGQRPFFLMPNGLDSASARTAGAAVAIEVKLGGQLSKKCRGLLEPKRAWLMRRPALIPRYVRSISLVGAAGQFFESFAMEAGFCRSTPLLPLSHPSKSINPSMDGIHAWNL